MERIFGEETFHPSEPMDKSRVLNVKPLRILAPIFPSSSNLGSFPTPLASAPFVSVPPSGPFPPGFAPFYPFSGSYDFNTPIADAVPITSFRTPPSQTVRGTHNSGAVNGGKRSSGKSKNQSGVLEDGYANSEDQASQYISDRHGAGAAGTSKSRKQKGRFQKRARGKLDAHDINVELIDVDMDSIVNNILTSSNHVAFDTLRRTNGDKESVEYILLTYDFLRRKISQIEETKQSSGIARRPDLRSGTILMNKGVRTNVKKRIGAVPGVEIGDIFFFRIEMCLIGLHAPCMAGIDYMGSTQEEEPVAVSIVSSGGYEDNVDDGDTLIYSGQGGNVNRKDKEVSDQKLVRGNLALEKSLHRGNEVRVIRGIRDPANPTGKIYVYDGLYRIHESWVDKGKSGCNVFKYKLLRLPGQAEAFVMWRSIQEWKDGISSRTGVILPDLTSGAENLPVSLVNSVDDEKGPAHFTYSPTLKYSKPVTSLEPSISCNCKSGCLPGNNCHCIQKNGGHLPYIANGVLVSQKSLIHECGPSCTCPPNCRNRVSQGGLKLHLEVFRTTDKGWGLRSWDPIRAGAFICEYAGEVINNSEADELAVEDEDDYIFYSTRTYQPPKFLPGDASDFPKAPFPLIISAKNVGNVARFMNHSCSPNVLWQPVLRDNSNACDLHIAFHAIKNIPPMTELMYDYGVVQPEKVDQSKKKCLCKSLKCRDYFY